MEEPGSPTTSEAEQTVTLTFSVAQVKLLREILEETAAPRGYENIKLVYELFQALQSNPTGEVFE